MKKTWIVIFLIMVILTAAYFFTTVSDPAHEQRSDAPSWHFVSSYL